LILKTGSKNFLKKTVYFLAVFFSLVVVLILITGVLNLVYVGKAYPRTRIGDLEVGGKSEGEVGKLVKELTFKILETKIILQGGGEQIEILPSEISLSYNFEATVKRALAEGRNIFGGLGIIKAVFFPSQVEADFEWDEERVNQIFLELEKQFNFPHQDAGIIIEGGKAEIMPAKNGSSFDVGENKKILASSLGHLKTAFPVSLNIKILFPEIAERDLVEIKKTIDQVLAEPIVLVADGKEYSLSPEEVVNLIAFEKSDSKLDVNISKNLLLEKLKNIAAEVNQEAVDAKLKIENGKAVVFALAQDGKKLPEEENAEKISKEIKAGSHRIDLKIETKKALVSSENIDSLGIKELVATGESNFSGSPRNRIHNIYQGAAIFNGVIIKPNEVFSFNKILGEVSSKTGFLPEMVIKEDKTIPEYGGGICQVSTTLYRAALLAGFPILERTPHAYRVVYYEPAGLDATVYLPKPDLVFKNDTSSYILIQTAIEGTKLFFRLYGTKTREVKIEGPQLSNITSPPPPLYEETDLLGSGEEKQVETAHNGATAVVWRKIYQDGNLVKEESFTSYYSPWRAKILVGRRTGQNSKEEENVREDLSRKLGPDEIDKDILPEDSLTIPTEAGN